VLTRVVHGSTFFVRVKVPAKGRITITGAGIKTVRKSVSKAGTYRLRVTLTAKETKALKRKLKLKLRVTYGPAGGTRVFSDRFAHGRAGGQPQARDEGSTSRLA